MLVVSEIMSYLPSHHVQIQGAIEVKSPLWYVRLSHTRLADAVLDMCGVPQKDSLRRLCFHILTRFASAPPLVLLATNSKRSRASEASQVQEARLVLDDAVRNHGMPKAAAEKLLVFVRACLPLHSDIHSSVESLKRAIGTLRGLEQSRIEPRKMKRFEDAAKSLKTVKDLIDVLGSLDIGPKLGFAENGGDEQRSRSRPLYISLDLGLRQRRRHYHGGIIYQCICLPENYFRDMADSEESHETLIFSTGRGTKVAEGGNYSELVRKNRPPGNFAAAFVNHYTTAPIPHCAGVRFSVGKFVELVYLDSTLSGSTDAPTDNWNDVDNQGMDALRRSLGHPMSYSRSVQCIVTGVHGMDAASKPERFLVASRLWAEGISAEYIPQSSVMLSLAKRMGAESTDRSGVNDFSLLELYGVCSLLKIPFIVIVQPHLLKDKGSVRLRQVPLYSLSSQGASSMTTSSNSGEMFVSLDNLATTILGVLSSSPDIMTEEAATTASSSMATAPREQRSSRVGAAAIDCIYVDNDHYFGNDREVNKSETPQWKSYIKVMKTVEMSATSYLASLKDSSSLGGMGMSGVPVFAVADKVSFWVLRDFGTALMRRERKEQSAAGACREMIEKYPCAQADPEDTGAGSG